MSMLHLHRGTRHAVHSSYFSFSCCARFSANAMAFFLRSGTSTIAQARASGLAVTCNFEFEIETLIEARNALCSLYLGKQKEAFNLMVEGSGSDLEALGLHIEFDETGQKLRLRRAWARDHQTTMSVLASWLHRLCLRSQSLRSFL